MKDKWIHSSNYGSYCPQGYERLRHGRKQMSQNKPTENMTCVSFQVSCFFAHICHLHNENMQRDYLHRIEYWAKKRTTNTHIGFGFCDWVLRAHSQTLRASARSPSRGRESEKERAWMWSTTPMVCAMWILGSASRIACALLLYRQRSIPMPNSNLAIIFLLADYISLLYMAHQHFHATNTLR